MKTLVVYYSRTGNTEKVGNELAKELKADVEKIIDLKNRIGAISWLSAGHDAMKKKLTEIVEIKKDPSIYDLVVVGTPVWVTVTPAIRTYLRNNKDKFKKLAFYSTKGGSETKTFKDMEEEAGKEPIATLELTTKEVNENSYKEKLQKFVDSSKKRSKLST